LTIHRSILLILVEQSAEPVTPEDVVDLGCCAPGEWPQGSGLAESAVRPVTELRSALPGSLGDHFRGNVTQLDVQRLGPQAQHLESVSGVFPMGAGLTPLEIGVQAIQLFTISRGSPRRLVPYA